MDQVPTNPMSLFTFLFHASTLLFDYVRHFLGNLTSTTTMASPVDSVAPGEGWVTKSSHSHRLVQLKTKEECRLGNETIQVWTVELPSRHAEWVLK